MRCIFKGRITNIQPEREYGAKKIREREIWCIEEGQENRKFPITLPFVSRYDPTSDTINPLPPLENLKIGDNVEFAFIPKSRFWRKDGIVKCIVSLKIASDIKVLDENNSPDELDNNNTGMFPKVGDDSRLSNDAHLLNADDMPF